MKKPLVAVTMGDPAGVGPEICVLALNNPAISEQIRPVVIGDLARLELARDVLRKNGRLTPANDRPLCSVKSVASAGVDGGRIDVLDMHNVPKDLPWGELRAEAGKACFEFFKHAVELGKKGEIDAICTAPINKEAWRASGIHYPGHMDALGDMLNVPQFATLLVNGKLRVVHVTTHVSLAQAIQVATRQRVFDRIKLTHDSFKHFGIARPKIAVAGLNPHAGENGLFGHEDAEHIVPAVKAAADLGIDVSGPYPADTIFYRAAKGEFDVVIAQYHDQGHIAIKMLGWDTGVNVTIGLPFLRTSVDHGTAFEVAGKGVATERSMVEALAVAIEFLGGQRPV